MKLEILAPPLRKILESELARGNEVQEVTAWPPKCHLLVILRRPFSMRYEPEPHVEFAEVNDMHYWKGEYRFRGGVQTVACNFGR
jgi:hypothetical protein